jgi:hypothetical protein
MTTVRYLLSPLPQAELPAASVQARVVSKYHTIGDVQISQLAFLLLVCRQDWPFCWGCGWRRWALIDPLIKKYIWMFLQHGYWHVPSAIKHQSSPNVKKKTIHGMQMVYFINAFLAVLRDSLAVAFHHCRYKLNHNAHRHKKKFSWNMRNREWNWRGI